VPVLNVGFSGNSGGQYHTAFDDFGVVERFLDPGFVGHELLGVVVAELLVELAARPGGGFDVAEAAQALAGHVRAAQQSGVASAEEAEALAAAFDACAAQARQVDQGAWRRPQRFYELFETSAPLAGRAWLRNSLWAPALENGYGVETFPHLRAARDAAARASNVAFTVERARSAVSSLCTGADQPKSPASR
jgi:N-acetylated-alpha-linked acidic dipeptidase